MEFARKYADARDYLLKQKRGLEAEKAFHRWLISNLNVYGTNFIFGKNNTSEFDLEFGRILEEKNIVQEGEGKNIVFTVKHIKGRDISMKKTKKGIEVEGEFYPTNDEDLALRYYSIGASGSQHFSVISEDYEKLVSIEEDIKKQIESLPKEDKKIKEKFALIPAEKRRQIEDLPEDIKKYIKDLPEYILEGFASPFNHYFRNYCSAFPEDKGSVGNFFNQNLAGKIVAINPPFILHILDAAVEKVRKTFLNTEEKTKIIFVGPAWTDAEFFMSLKRSEFLINMETRYHPYINRITGKVIKDQFLSTWFVLQNY